TVTRSSPNMSMYFHGAWHSPLVRSRSSTRIIRLGSYAQCAPGTVSARSRSKKSPRLRRKRRGPAERRNFFSAVPFFPGFFLFKYIPDDNADDSRVKEEGKVRPYPDGEEIQAIKLRDDQQDKTNNKKQVAELGFRNG